MAMMKSDLDKGPSGMRRSTRQRKPVSYGDSNSSMMEEEFDDDFDDEEDDDDPEWGDMGEWNGPCDYSHLPDSADVGPYKYFTSAQKEKIVEANMEHNGGIARSDKSGIELVRAEKSKKGVVPSQDEWQVDHIEPRSKGGTNSFKNAQLLSREENREKSDN